MDGTNATWLSNTSINDPYFQFFYCGGSKDHTYTCYKYQRISSKDGEPRFDTDSTSVKYLYWDGSTLTRKSAGTLTGALAGLSASVGLVTAILSLSFS